MEGEIIYRFVRGTGWVPEYEYELPTEGDLKWLEEDMQNSILRTFQSLTSVPYSEVRVSQDARFLRCGVRGCQFCDSHER